MASSRHLKGTVLSRVRDLLKSGVLKEKPVWYDVMATFPPLAEADLSTKADYGHVEKIVYPEDAVRRKFFSKYETEALSLKESTPTETTCDRFVEKCVELIKNGTSESEAFDKTVIMFKDELKERKVASAPSKRTKPNETPQTLYDILNVKDFDTSKDE